MPRKPRFFLPDIPAHIAQRGHSREPVFFEDSDYRVYLDWVAEAANRYRCAVHAYVLMTNHVHILATPQDKHGISLMMQYIGRHYVPYINHSYGTSGSIWEGRYKASLVSDDQYLLACMRYIELNPVRANMIDLPAHYRWSSYRANAQGKVDELITTHPLYLSLGRTVSSRLEAYRALFKAHIETSELKAIRVAWQTGTPLGNDYFREKIERKLMCKVGQARRGRPNRH
ncbi:MAG TPA: transposase [Acidiferrobacteraceae bacterium]|nr:transposase [Acidiferrobacteraceae bacterium]